MPQPFYLRVRSSFRRESLARWPPRSAGDLFLQAEQLGRDFDVLVGLAVPEKEPLLAPPRRDHTLVSVALIEVKA
jgi:hypothetical protein